MARPPKIKQKDPLAVVLGRRGGKVRSEAKTAACRVSLAHARRMRAIKREALLDSLIAQEQNQSRTGKDRT